MAVACSDFKRMLLVCDQIFVLAFQYTINSKKVEVAVKRIISGETVGQKGALANPNSLNLYHNIPELQIACSNGASNPNGNIANGNGTMA